MLKNDLCLDTDVSYVWPGVFNDECPQQVGILKNEAYD